MLKPASLQQVVEGGLCTGCGICESMMGRERIRMQLSSAGHMRPAFLEEPTDRERARLISVCPGRTVHGPGTKAREPGTAVHPIWGPVRAISRAWAADPSIRHHAAAGGVLTALAVFLIESQRVDAVVHVRASEEAPMLSEALVSRTRSEVLSGAQSRYGPSSPLVHVNALLDEGIRFAVVAKPCDISAIRNLQRQDARAAARIPYLLTIFCGGVVNSGVTEKIAASAGIEAGDVSLFRFRGEGWPGMTRVEGRDGTVLELTYRQAWFDPQPWRYDIQWRCKICPDAIGELADLSVPDGWVLDPQGRPLHDEAPGVNAVLERTAAGSELMAASIGAGYLETADLPPREFELMHHDHRTRKLGEPARLAALLLCRAATPDVRGYRMAAAARRAPWKLLWSQLWGALRRVRAGQATERLDPPAQPSRTSEYG
jgi:coenzyme F420 hydrogenase subunit beta